METFQPFVYGLYSPTDVGHIRYVGMAPSNPMRPYQHAKRARKDVAFDSYLMHWIRKVQSEGYEPEVMILEQMPVGTSKTFLGFIEASYIKSLREIGHKLTNIAPGGIGGSNGPHTPKSRAAMRAGWTDDVRKRVGIASRQRALGRPRSEASRKKQSEARLGQPLSEINKQGIRRGRKAAWDAATPEERALHARNTGLAMQRIPGHVQTDQTRQKISKALAGRVMSEEWREKNAAAQRGKKASDETRARQSASAKAAWAKRKGAEV